MLEVKGGIRYMFCGQVHEEGDGCDDDNHHHRRRRRRRRRRYYYNDQLSAEMRDSHRDNCSEEPRAQKRAAQVDNPKEDVGERRGDWLGVEHSEQQVLHRVCT